jgi:4-amino-4-deoxy-L-arabinose transferase-like glycosyltransferase
MNAFSLKNLRGDYNFLKAFWVVFGLALALRLVGITDPLVSDELASASIWGQMPLDQIPKNYQFPNNHIFHSILVGLLLKLFGVNEFVLRMPALVAGLLSIYFVFVCAKRITDKPLVALGAAFLMTFNVEHIYYSTNARGYTLTQTFALATFLLILPLIQNFEKVETEKNNDLSWLSYFGVFIFCSLGSWTIPTFGLYEGALLVGIVCSFLFYRRQIHKQIRIFIKLLLVLFSVLGILYVQYFVVIPKSMLVRAIVNGAGAEPAHFLENLLTVFSGSQIQIGYGILVFAIIGFWGLFKTERKVAIWFGILFGVPIAVIFLSYWVGISQKIPHPRILLYLQPFFLICASNGVWISISRLNSNFEKNKNFKIAIICVFSVSLGSMLLFAAKDFQTRQITERNDRALYNEGLKFFRQLGPNDLILVSKQTHVWFYLYGAQEMRKRVLRIIETRKLGDVYFIENYNNRRDQSDLKVKTTQNHVEVDMSHFSLHPLAHDKNGHIQISKLAWKLEKDFGAFKIYKIPEKYFIRTLSLNKLNDKNQWTISSHFKDKIKLTKNGIEPSITLEYKDSFFISENYPRKFKQTDSGLNINFLRTNHLPGVHPIFGGAEEELNQVKFAPTWLANDWVMEHPYSKNYFSRRWFPNIFLSQGGKVLVLAGSLENDYGVGKIKNVLGFQLAIK